MLQLSVDAMTLPGFRLVLDPAIPEVFRLADGIHAAAINQDGTMNSEANPAKIGSIVSIWATGIGFMPGVDGQIQTAPHDFHYCTIRDAGNGRPITLTYDGAAPGMITGIVQIHFQVTNNRNFCLTVNGSNSGFFSIFVN